jgi:hypothetical protein
MKFAEKNDGEGMQLRSFPHRVLLDQAYLKAVYGDKAYLPPSLDFSMDDLTKLDKELDLVNLRQSSADWVD